MDQTFRGRAESPSNTKNPWAEAYFHTKWHLDASSRLATIEMGRKLGRGFAPFWGKRAGSPSNKVAWAEAYLHAEWHLDQCSHFAATDMGRKLGRGSWVPT